MQVCARCEAPFGDAAVAAGEDDVDLFPRPAAPSPTQSHGTVMVAVLLGFVVLAVLLSLSVRGVGPFRATVVSAEPGGESARVTVTVTNEGRKPGHGKCRIARLSATGDREQDFQFLSERVRPHATITQTVEVPLRQGSTTGEVDC
jgi:hypothetical protein